MISVNVVKKIAGTVAIPFSHIRNTRYFVCAIFPNEIKLTKKVPFFSLVIMSYLRPV